MSSARTLKVVVGVLIGILVIAGASITMVRHETVAFPSASSYGLSGTRALADLLRANGYEVKITTNVKPHLEKSDTIVAFRFGGSFTSLDQDEASYGLVSEHLRNGGSAVVFDLSRNFQNASEKASQSVLRVKNLDGTQDAVNMPSPEAPNEQFVKVEETDGGRTVNVSDGIPATNRFIDQNDNADAVLRAIAAAAPAHGRLVFTEATFGNRTNPSMLELIGPWALAGWWQLILLGVIVVWTLGKPFGYPDEERLIQAGSRELVDAVAQTYRRARATDVALKSLLEDADADIRRKLKLPIDSTRADRNRLIPPELAQAMANVEAASEEKIQGQDALVLAKKLNKALNEFVGERPLRRRKSKF